MSQTGIVNRAFFEASTGYVESETPPYAPFRSNTSSDEALTRSNAKVMPKPDKFSGAIKNA